MTKILVDNQLPVALAHWLRGKGCDAEHVSALGMGQVPDAAIWAHAAKTGSAIISKDEDFAQMTLVRSESVAVVWLRVGNCRTAHLLGVMERTWPTIEQQLQVGAKLIEVC